MNEKPFILFLEDVAEDFLLVNRELGQSGLSFETKQVETKEAFVKELEEHRPDVILTDHGLHNFDAFSALALAKEKAPGTPVIFVTGSLGDEAAIRALKSGATDYVLKHRLVELASAVRRALGLVGERQLETRPASEDGGRLDVPETAEDQIRRLNRELEQRVAERSAQLEAAKRELEAFSYSVSHDLRAPLRHIDGFVDLLKQSLGENLEGPSREYLRIISDSAQEMNKLMDALLAFSRMGRAALRPCWVDMTPLVGEVLHEFRFESEGRQIEWMIGDLSKVIGDPSLLRQVWLNLLSNALKFTRPRAVARVQIAATSTEQEMIFSIRDNGIGFDMEYAGKLFGVFQRLHTASEFEGTGIGLANVRRIIQRHGGRTWAEAAPDQGATFYFSLPNAKEEEKHG